MFLVCLSAERRIGYTVCAFDLGVEVVGRDGVLNKLSAPGSCGTILGDGESAISIVSGRDKSSASTEAVEVLVGDLNG